MKVQHTRSEAEVTELADEELAAVSAGAIFMKYDNTKGEVIPDDHRSWIE
jgi:hypothetical protein